MNVTLWAFVFAISFVLTWGLRRYALTHQVMDIPNARSSHQVPTPRGGGLAIVVTFLGALPFLAWTGTLRLNELCALFGAGLITAVIGFIDDHRHIDARWRLLGHFIAAFWGLAWLGGLPSLSIFGHVIDMGVWGALLAAVYLVWLLNLYNFMDGIDGIASIEAICVGIGSVAMYAVAGLPTLSAISMILIAAVAGFVLWNFPVARIFMGDAGSGFLGIVLGLLSLMAAWADQRLFWGWLILLGVFIVDATITLLRRLFRGDRIYQAHRSHAYQYAARQAGRHAPVTWCVALINLVWLLPLSIWVALGGIDGTMGLLLAYSPLVILALLFHAGKQEA